MQLSHYCAININYLRNKIAFLSLLITGYLDVLLESEKKLDDSLPTVQFRLNGIAPHFRLGCCSNGGSILLYVRVDIPSSPLSKYKPPRSIECFFVEVNSKKKLLLRCSYNPGKNNLGNYLHHLRKDCEINLKHFDNVFILGDLKSDISAIFLNNFYKLNNLKNLVKSPICINLISLIST